MHVYARLNGFGWIFVPRAPYHFQQLPDYPRGFLATHSSAMGSRTVTIRCMEDELQHEFAPGTSDLSEVLDVERTSFQPHWRIETSVFTMRWPAGFDVTSPADQVSPFDLCGPGRSLIFVRGPFAKEKFQSWDAMVGPGQRIRGTGDSPGSGWVDLDYDHDGPWSQRHYVVSWSDGRVLVVTAQSPNAHFPPTVLAGDEVVNSILPSSRSTS